MMRLPRLAQLVLVFFPSPEPGRLAMILISLPRAASSMNFWASGSGSMPSTRSSVDRSARDTSDMTTMLRMKTEAILMPSGRSKMFVMLV